MVVGDQIVTSDNRWFVRHARSMSMEKMPNAVEIGRHFYAPGKGYRLNWWRRIVRAIVRFF